MRFLVALVLALNLVLLSFCESLDPIVDTEYGSVEGFFYKMESGEDAEIFLGIPFAAPPIGNLRFEKPQEPEKWNETLKAKEFPPACATFDTIMGHGVDEDCLYLNIFKPKELSKDGYPIMFFIYGGGFVIGDTKTYEYKNISDNLVSKGIIVVTIQHRLGPFGFFSTGDSRIPGNLGLWDQIQALKFINKVIDKFNGDKNRITISGVSAGGASVSLLGLSEEAYGLFAQVLPMSGSAFAEWATKNDVVKVSKEAADNLGCDRNSTAIKECLKTKNVSEIQRIFKPIIKFFSTLLQLGPRMDGDFIKVKCLKEATKNAPKKPIFIGLCSQEAIMHTTQNQFFPSGNKYFNLPAERANNYTKEDFEEFVRVNLAQEKYFGNKTDEFVKEVVEFYANQTAIQDSNYNFFFEQFTDLMSDIKFNVPSEREALLKAKNNNPTFFYVYDYNVDITDTTPKLSHGATHGADVVNLFGGLYKPIELDDTGRKVQKNFVDLIANFIKNGIPSTDSVTVPQFNSESLEYVLIGAETEIKKDLWKKRLEFWDQIGPKYGYDLTSGIYLNKKPE